MILTDYTDVERLTKDNTLNTKNRTEIELLDQRLAENPNDTKALIKKGFVFFESHMDGKAIEAFNKVLLIDPVNIDAYMWLGELLLFHWADAESALPLLKHALEINAQRSEIHYLLGCAYSEQNKISEAIIATKKAVELEPRWTHPRMCIIEYQLKAGNTEEAKRQIQQLEEHLQPNIPEPTDEMEYYYETLITGRYLQGYGLEWLNRLREQETKNAQRT